MSFFLDTNICIYILKGKFPAIKEVLSRLSPHEIKVPSMVLAELRHGAIRCSTPDPAQRASEKLVQPFEIVPFGPECAEFFAQTRESLERKGEIIGPYDLIIAATVLSHKGTLVTHNTREFQRIKGLSIVDWTV